MIRVALVDDQDLIRGVLRAILDAEDDIEVGGEAADGGGAVHLATARLADSKLGLRDRVQAVVLAYECGLVLPQRG